MDSTTILDFKNTTTFQNLVILHTYPPMKMEQTVFSELDVPYIRASFV